MEDTEQAKRFAKFFKHLVSMQKTEDSKAVEFFVQNTDRQELELLLTYLIRYHAGE